MGLFVITQKENSITTQVNTDDGNELDSLKSRLNQLENNYRGTKMEMAILKHRKLTQPVQTGEITAELSERNTVPSDDQNVDEEKISLSPEEIEAQQREEVKQQCQKFDLVLNTESVDENWLNESLNDVNNLLNSEGVGGNSLESLSCGQSLCRAIVSNNSLKSFFSFRDSAINGHTFKGATYIAYNEEDHSTSIYFGRAGKELPIFE